MPLHRDLRPIHLLILLIETGPVADSEERSACRL